MSGSVTVRDGSTSGSALGRITSSAHAMTGFLLILLSTVLAVSLFAGREFAGATEVALYRSVEAAMSGLWVITAIVGLVGHFRWRSKREANQEGRRSSLGPASMLHLGELGVS